jgi:hypothetical protein
MNMDPNNHKNPLSAHFSHNYLLYSLRLARIVVGPVVVAVEHGWLFAVGAMLGVIVDLWTADYWQWTKAIVVVAENGTQILLFYHFWVFTFVVNEGCGGEGGDCGFNKD